MNKRIVLLTFKHTDEKKYFKKVSDIYALYSERELGISRLALYNGLSKGHGRYENKFIVIRYQKLN